MSSLGSSVLLLWSSGRGCSSLSSHDIAASHSRTRNTTPSHAVTLRHRSVTSASPQPQNTVSPPSGKAGRVYVKANGTGIESGSDGARVHRHALRHLRITARRQPSVRQGRRSVSARWLGAARGRGSGATKVRQHTSGRGLTSRGSQVKRGGPLNN